MNKISKPLYKGARVSRDVNAFIQCFKQRSIMPLIRRAWNKLIGRKIVSKMWWRK